MKKQIRRKIVAKKTSGARSARRRAPKDARSHLNKTSVVPENDGKLSFNHAMIYAKDAERGLAFYRDLLGFKLIEDFRFENKPVYARLRAPGGDGTIALHQAGPDDSVSSDGVRLYFEVKELDEFCHKLQQKKFYITKMPRMMPWGWRQPISMTPMVTKLVCTGLAKIA